MTPISLSLENELWCLTSREIVANPGRTVSNSNTSRHSGLVDLVMHRALVSMVCLPSEHCRYVDDELPLMARKPDPPMT